MSDNIYLINKLNKYANPVAIQMNSKFNKIK